MADLVRLAKLDPNDVSDGVPNKKPRLSIKLNAKHREGRPPRATDVAAADNDDAAARDSSNDCRVAGFPRTPAEHVALLRDAERILDERTTRSLADDVLSRSRAVDDLVAGLPGMTRTRLMQMDIIAGLIRDNRDVGREMEEAHAIARIRREEVRKALAENTCLALGVEDEDS
ncbi:hypothetical protein ACHAW5_010751 [Stephanodiscus triporus]|uniref:Mediator of RNA polymerase II transcription subunit 21 n=1 Tax=Stephanodiscus triporus TaxID=2934178 RepID=A0ABD3MJX3_9STRA